MQHVAPTVTVPLLAPAAALPPNSTAVTVPRSAPAANLHAETVHAPAAAAPATTPTPALVNLTFARPPEATEAESAQAEKPRTDTNGAPQVGTQGADGTAHEATQGATKARPQVSQDAPQRDGATGAPLEEAKQGKKKFKLAKLLESSGSDGEDTRLTRALLERIGDTDGKEGRKEKM